MIFLIVVGTKRSLVFFETAKEPTGIAVETYESTTISRILFLLEIASLMTILIS